MLNRTCKKGCVAATAADAATAAAVTGSVPPLDLWPGEGSCSSSLAGGGTMCACTTFLTGPLCVLQNRKQRRDLLSFSIAFRTLRIDSRIVVSW